MLQNLALKLGKSGQLCSYMLGTALPRTCVLLLSSVARPLVVVVKEKDTNGKMTEKFQKVIWDSEVSREF